MAEAGLAQTQRQTVHRYYVGDGIDGVPERGTAESFRSLEAALDGDRRAVRGTGTIGNRIAD